MSATSRRSRITLARSCFEGAAGARQIPVLVPIGRLSTAQDSFDDVSYWAVPPLPDTGHESPPFSRPKHCAFPLACTAWLFQGLGASSVRGTVQITAAIGHIMIWRISGDIFQSPLAESFHL
jgi:hypothetical protein